MIDRNRFVALAAVPLSACCIPAWADTATLQLPMDKYGHISQNNGDVLGGENACGPTSAVNSFIYLEKQFGLKGLVASDDNGNPTDAQAISAINQLSLSNYMNRTGGDAAVTDAFDSNYTDLGLDINGFYDDLHNAAVGGVSIGNFINGKTQWIKDHGLADKIKVESFTNPTSADIYAQLKAGQDVEMWLDWWNGTRYTGAHFVTLTGMTWNDANNNGMLDNGEVAQSLSFIDPYGPAGGAVDRTTTSLQLITPTAGASFLYLSYTGGAAGTNVGRASIGYIVAESPVPLPSAAWMVMAMLGLSGLAGRYQSNKAERVQD